jgi:hypothetical protein
MSVPIGITNTVIMTVTPTDTEVTEVAAP